MIAAVLLALHLLGAVAWVGGMLFAILVLRPSLVVLQPADRVALHAQVFRRFFLVVWHAMPVTLLSGWAMLAWVFGGFATAGLAVNLMQLLGIIMAVVFAMIFFGPWRRLRRAITAAAGGQAAERIRGLVTINLVLGLIVIVLGAIAHFS